MTRPAQGLHDDIALIDDALEPFTAPIVNERSGLRWMQRTLEDRRRHILDKIATAERSTLTARVGTATGTPDVPAAVAAAVLTAVQEHLCAAGEQVDWPDAVPEAQRRAALTLEVGDATTDGQRWELTLHRPAGPLDAQPTVAGGDRTAFDAAVDALFDALEDGGDDGELVGLVAEHGIALELAATPATGRPRTCALTRRTVATGG